MANKRFFVFYNPVTGEFERAGAGDVLGNIVGTEVQAGEVYDKGDLLVTSKADSKAYKADATDDDLREVAFIALESAPVIDEVHQVALPGNEIPGLTLDEGEPYFLDPANPGKMTKTPPSTTGHWVVKVGVASSDTELVFNPSPMKIKL